MSQDTTDLATSPIYLPLNLTHNSSAPHLLSGLMMSSLNVMRDTYPPAAAALVATPSLEAVAVGASKRAQNSKVWQRIARITHWEQEWSSMISTNQELFRTERLHDDPSNLPFWELI